MEHISPLHLDTISGQYSSLPFSLYLNKEFFYGGLRSFLVEVVSLHKPDVTFYLLRS